MELLEDGGAAAGSSRMASRRLRLDIQVGGAAGRLCARKSGVFSEGARAGWGWGAATTRMPAGWELEPTQQRAGAGRSRRAQHFKFSSGREVGREPGCGRAGRPEPAREGLVRGAVRGLTTWAGSLGELALQEECGIARGRTSFASTDG